MNQNLLPQDQRVLRLVMLLSGIGFLWFALFAKTFHAQVVKSGYYTEKVKSQSERRVMLKPERGRVLDRHGNILADNYNGKTRENPDARNKFRIYPYGSLASQVIGNVGWNGRGVSGVEYSLDQELYGLEGWAFKKVDARKRTYHGYELEGQMPSAGLDIVLTIDVEIQDIVEQALENQVEYLEAKSGSAIVMDPKTGEIIAMANYPSFNPNNIEKGSVIRNDAIQKTYEPGSTYKMITAAAALEEQKVDLKEKIDTEGGRLKIYGDIISDTHDYGNITFKEAMAFSSNIAFAKLATRVGSEKFYRYSRSFGFGMTTGIDLPAEEKGRLKELNKWSGRTLSTMAMGHEISTTPLQVLTAISAIANGGKLMRPRIIKKYVSSHDNKVVKEINPQVIRRVISSETAHKLKVITKDVVEYGTARNLKSDLVSLSGKTGTAEKFDWEKKAYSKTKMNSSFVGMIPAEDPQYVSIVVIDEPITYTSGAKTAGPVFKEIAENLVVLPKSNGPRWLYANAKDRTVVEAFEKKKFKELKIDSLYKNQKVIVSGKGDWVVHQTPGAGTELQAGDSLTLVLGNPSKEIPNLKGFSLAKVLELIENKGIQLSVDGKGRVNSQWPKAGSSWNEIKELKLSLGDYL